MAGGQVPDGVTLTPIEAFVPSTGKVLNAGLLPQADAFAGYTTVASAHGAVGYMVGGEVPPSPAPTRPGWPPAHCSRSSRSASVPTGGRPGRPARALRTRARC